MSIDILIIEMTKHALAQIADSKARNSTCSYLSISTACHGASVVAGVKENLELLEYTVRGAVGTGELIAEW